VAKVISKAFLVVGPESSGTHLSTRLLMNAGCFGDTGHPQAIDRDGFPDDNPLIVWRRSLPFAGRWPNLPQMVNRLDRYDTVTAIITCRDWHAMISSQLVKGHARGGEDALSNIRHAYKRIYHMLGRFTHVQPIMISYEALVQRPGRYGGEMLRMMGLQPANIDVYDGNEKHYE
jgi:hypothetical protein